MVRAKKTELNEGEIETRSLLESFQQKFKEDLTEMEKAKREFSASFSKKLIEHLKSVLPDAFVLDMRATDFVATIKNDNEEAAMKTPVGTSKPFKSVETPSGVKLQIPNTISTRVDGGGAVLKSRVPRLGEVLFSLHGTPVLVEK